MAPYSILLLSLLFLSLSPTFLIADSAYSGDEETVHLHFYIHFIENQTEVVVAKSDIRVPGSFYNFGSIVVVDNPLTEGINITSKPVGKVQGLFSVMDSLTVVWSANIVFTTGQYNGSSIAILGPDNITKPVREVSIVGGSGYFRRAQGHILLKTVSVDFDTGDAEAEVDVYVDTWRSK
ncbi:Dirigent protein [Rhynchospora pubera]|uniref:Dirigent protein n=1 Tax=Rhynchospora pubera TaxID=906938 RepID=A0AAV8HGA6_9POAL|nr:Dirigent protein [Rhynchospora pubera]